MYVLLIYGQSEQSFDVASLVERLTDKSIQVQTYEGHHGFADLGISRHYNQQSSTQAFSHTKEFLKGNCVTFLDRQV